MAGDVNALLADACADLARAIARPEATPRVLESVTSHLARTLGVEAAGVVLGDPDGHLDVASATDDVIAEMLKAEQDAAEGPSMAAVAESTAVRVNTVSDTDGRWPGWHREARARGVGAWLTVPSRFEESTVVLCASSTQARRWEDDEVAAVQVMADLAAGCVARETELGRARRTADQLQEALDSRLVIEQAKGILAGELRCTLDQAFAMLRDHARRNSVTVRAVAGAVVQLGLRPPQARGGQARGDQQAPRSP